MQHILIQGQVELYIQDIRPFPTIEMKCSSSILKLAENHTHVEKDCSRSKEEHTRTREYHSDSTFHDGFPIQVHAYLKNLHQIIVLLCGATGGKREVQLLKYYRRYISLEFS